MPIEDRQRRYDDPTPEEIQEMSLLIQSEWTVDEKIKRSRGANATFSLERLAMNLHHVIKR